MNRLIHTAAAAVFRVVARLAEKSPAIRDRVRNSKFRGKTLVVTQIRAEKLPRHVVAESSGLKFNFDLADDVCREIYFNIFDHREIGLVRSLIPAGGTCLDIGANIGFYSLLFAKQVGPSGEVHAFEPDPQNMQRLQANLALNPFASVVRPHALAVSDTAGEVSFFKSSADHSGWGSLVEFKDISVGAVTVPAVTLDEFLESQKIERVDFMKVDVEAHEFELIAGAQKTLAAKVFKHILIEFNGPRMYERGRTLEQFLEEFAKHGYEPMIHPAAVLPRVQSGELKAPQTNMNLIFRQKD